MSQHDLTIDNANGSTVRSDLQAALQALGTLQSGSSEPSTTYAYMLWADTGNNLLKQRNAANSGWIIRGTLSETRALSKSSAYTVIDDDFGALIKATGTWSLALTAAATLADGFWFEVRNTGSGTITIDPNSTEQIDGATTITLAAGESCKVVCDGSAFFSVGKSASSSSSSVFVPVRQTVLSGPVDSNGLPAFGGSTGGTTVTMSGTLVATAANGFGSSGAVDVVGSGTNLSWTGLSTNGTMYLYCDIAAGALTTGSGTLAPAYQFGGTYSTTSGQFTFNIQEMTGKVGNGSSATQTNRVYMGEVTVAGGVVTAIVWYALQRRYMSAETSIPAANTVQAFSHNLGITTGIWSRVKLINKTTEANYAVGQFAVPYENFGSGFTPLSELHNIDDRKTGNWGYRTSDSVYVKDHTTFFATAITTGNWRMIAEASASW